MKEILLDNMADLYKVLEGVNSGLFNIGDIKIDNNLVNFKIKEMKDVNYVLNTSDFSEEESIDKLNLFGKVCEFREKVKNDSLENKSIIKEMFLSGTSKDLILPLLGIGVFINTVLIGNLVDVGASLIFLSSSVTAEGITFGYFEYNYKKLVNKQIDLTNKVYQGTKNLFVCDLVTKKRNIYYKNNGFDRDNINYNNTSSVISEVKVLRKDLVR